jgi:hypothetical protein
VGRNTGRLVHHHDVGVLIDDGQSRHRLRYRHGCGRRRQGDVEPLPGRHAIRLGGGPPGHEHLPAGDQVGRSRAGKPEHPRERGVEALAIQPLRDGHPALVPRGHALLSPAALPRS